MCFGGGGGHTVMELDYILKVKTCLNEDTMHWSVSIKSVQNYECFNHNAFSCFSGALARCMP